MEEQNKYDQMLSMYNTQLDDAEIAAKVAQIIEEKLLPVLSKSGYRTEIDKTDLNLGYDIFTDVSKYSLIFLNFLIFALSVSSDGKCHVKITPFENYATNVFRFNYKPNKSENVSENDLSYFADKNPYEYINIRPFEYFCNKKDWKISLKITEEDNLNAALTLKINIKNLCIYSI